MSIWYSRTGPPFGSSPSGCDVTDDYNWTTPCPSAQPSLASLWHVMQLIAVLLVILVIGVPVVLIWIVGRWVLAPIDRAGQLSMRPTRYRIVDFFCLILELQVAMMGVTLTVSDTSARFVIGGLAVFLVFTVWFKGVSTLSCAGIEDPWRRAAFNWFVLPVTYAASLGAAPMVFGFLYYWNQWERRVPLLVWFGVIACPVGIVIAKRLSRWIVAGAAGKADAHDQI